MAQNGACRMQAQDEEVFPIPYPRDVSDIKGAVLWIFANLDVEAQKND